MFFLFFPKNTSSAFQLTSVRGVCRGHTRNFGLLRPRTTRLGIIAVVGRTLGLRPRPPSELHKEIFGACDGPNLGIKKSAPAAGQI
jgi:hypothetical protein